jgi:hypothetical protein
VARPTPNFAPSWNAAPTDPLLVVRYDPKARERSLDVLRWGLVPFWAKDLKVGFANINAKAEGIENRPAFRDAFERRRCLVPVAVALPLMLAEIEADIATAGPIERCRLSRPSWVWRRIGGPAPAQR